MGSKHVALCEEVHALRQEMDNLFAAASISLGNGEHITEESTALQLQELHGHQARLRELYEQLDRLEQEASHALQEECKEQKEEDQMVRQATSSAESLQPGMLINSPSESISLQYF